MSIIGLLIGLIVLCVVFWAANALMTAFQVGDPIRTVVIVLIVVLALLWLAQLAGVHVPGLRTGVGVPGLQT